MPDFTQPAVDIFTQPAVDIFARPAAADPSPVTADRAGHARVADISIKEDLIFARRATRRRYLHALNVSNAAKHLRRLPKRGETLHAIMKGNYHAWDLLPAILKLAEPATITDLWVATLGFNQDNTVELLELMDNGAIGRVTFICSLFFKAHNPEVFTYLTGELKARTGRGRAAAIRNHAKILALRMSDRRHFVVESSANLRSCNNIEQFALTHDAGLYRLHAGWMDEVVATEADREAVK